MKLKADKEGVYVWEIDGDTGQFLRNTGEKWTRNISKRSVYTRGVNELVRAAAATDERPNIMWQRRRLLSTNIPAMTYLRHGLLRGALGAAPLNGVKAGQRQHLSTISRTVACYAGWLVLPLSVLIPKPGGIFIFPSKIGHCYWLITIIQEIISPFDVDFEGGRHKLFNPAAGLMNFGTDHSA